MYCLQLYFLEIMVRHTAVDESPTTRITITTVEVWVADDDVAFLDACFVFPDLRHLGGKLVAGSFRIGKIGECWHTMDNAGNSPVWSVQPPQGLIKGDYYHLEERFPPYYPSKIGRASCRERV